MTTSQIEVLVVPDVALIWENKIEGWSNYLDKYTSYGICTQAEFDAALNS
jgi:hypothetical protein